MQKTESSSSTTTTLQRPSKGIPGIPATRPSKGIPDIPVTHDIPAPPGNSTSSSILQLECIFYKFYSSIGFHRKLHRVPVGQYKLQTFILQRKGDVVISVNLTFSRIELRVKVTSEKTNCKNDIQQFPQLFDE